MGVSLAFYIGEFWTSLGSQQGYMIWTSFFIYVLHEVVYGIWYITRGDIVVYRVLYYYQMVF